MEYLANFKPPGAMKNIFNVEGKVALITGASGGLGYAFARGLAEHGAIVILNGRSKEKLDERIRELKKDGFDVHASVFDVTDEEQVIRAVGEIERHSGPVDILVNNAGVQVRAPLEQFKEDDWQKIISVNLTGAYHVSRAVVQSMIKRKSGKIINIGSLMNELGRPNIAPYAASKGGLKMLTRGMAVDWAKYNIQVNGIAPGYFKTAMTRALYEDPEFDAWLCQRTPSQRWGFPEELIGALLFLASEASSYVNGHMIYVDGGLMSSV
jgi:gluconate 5-dehydrogenase